MILRLWRDWCRLWPEQYGHNSLAVKPAGYDPVFEVIDTALNQIRAPESSVVAKLAEQGNGAHAPARADHARVAGVALPGEHEPPFDHEADTA